MNKVLTAALAASVAVSALSTAAFAEGKKIGVSWSNFQEERWKTDEAAMKSAIEANGDSYISADAQSSAAKQLTDVESLIAQGADALRARRRGRLAGRAQCAAARDRLHRAASRGHRGQGCSGLPRQMK